MSFLTWEFHQWVMVVYLSAGFLASIINHGKPAPDYDWFNHLLRLVFIVSVLGAGGFWK